MTTEAIVVEKWVLEEKDRRIAELEAEVKNLLENQNIIIEQRSEMKNKIKEYSDFYTELQKERDELKAELAVAKLFMKDARNEADQLKTREAELKREIEELKKNKTYTSTYTQYIKNVDYAERYDQLKALVREIRDVMKGFSGKDGYEKVNVMLAKIDQLLGDKE